METIPAPARPIPSVPAPAVLDTTQPLNVVVRDIEMTFGSMVVFMVKWVFAAIPAMLILALFLGFFGAFFGGMFAAMGGGG